jgi:protein-S-isoprenylcysteine O-methyltransferase Ste14
MRRRFRRSASGAFPADVMSPLFRTVAFLIVLALIFSWTRNPQSWRWLENNSEPNVVTTGAGEGAAAASSGGQRSPGKTAAPEVIVPGPTDQDQAQAAEAKNLFQAVTDRAPLAQIEMPAYWRCLKWARAQSFAELDRRAIHGLVYTQLWEQPDKYRGKLIRLRLHVQRILDWEAPQNSAGVHRVYEAWGWTDESKSFPYVVVLSDVPQGIPLGDNVRQEGVFVGYFLKTMAYTAYNRNRSSPLLLGRMEWLPATATTHPVVNHRDWVWITAVGIPVVLLIIAGTWWRMRRFRAAPLPAAAPADEAEMESWFRNTAATSAGENAANNPTNLPS